MDSKVLGRAWDGQDLNTKMNQLLGDRMAASLLTSFGFFRRWVGHLLAISGAAFLTSCAHHRDVRPGSDGLHRVVFQTEDKNQGFRDAMSQAQHFCESRGARSPVIVNEDSKYTGSMDEQSYKTGKTVAKVAQAAGGAAYVFGGRNERNAGGIVGLGGGIANSAMGEGYTYEMKFKCEN